MDNTTVTAEILPIQYAMQDFENIVQDALTRHYHFKLHDGRIFQHPINKTIINEQAGTVTILAPKFEHAMPPKEKALDQKTFRDVQNIITALVLATPINKLEEALHEKFREIEADLFG